MQEWEDNLCSKSQTILKKLYVTYLLKSGI